jgi:putative Mg2+ transporter-C (MgtC) family protein
MTLSEIYNAISASLDSAEIDTISSIYKLVVSLFLGSMVGFERKRRGQTAGVRTFSLISMGSSLAMIVSIYEAQCYAGQLSGDPTRIAASVVSGVGFLGAGAIIQMKGSVRGLTTAAGIWMVSAIGMAVGVGLYWLAFVATLLILFILVQLEKIEHRISLGAESRIISITLSEIVEDIEPYRQCLKQMHIALSRYYIEYDYAAGKTKLNLAVLVQEGSDYVTIFKNLRELFPTEHISLETQITI